MGLFDQVASAVGGMPGAQGAGSQGLVEGIMKMINDPQTGGLAGLVQKFQAGGLGDIVQSWVSTGQNLPVSPEQVQSALGGSQLQNLASQLGVDTSQLSGQLAQMLPQVVDKLTPTGAIPQGNDLMAQGMDLLKGKLFS